MDEYTNENPDPVIKRVGYGKKCGNDHMMQQKKLYGACKEEIILLSVQIPFIIISTG